MEMYTVIGGLMVFISCSLIGFGASRLYRLRVKQLEAFLRLISHIKAQIEYFRTPLDNIIAEYEDTQLSGCGFLLAARELGLRNGFESCRGRLMLSDDESDELMKFFDILGKNSADEESRYCTYYEKMIGDALNRECADLAKRSKLCKTFGMLAGFLLAVLLV